MKNKILIILLLIIVGSAMVWGILRSQKRTNENIIPVATGGKQQDNTTSTETIILSSKKPNSLDGVKMVTYKNPHGYEVTYPANWDELGLPDIYGDQKDDTSHHYFSLYPINEELHRLLLKPIGCEDETSCDKYFEKYLKKDYSLFEIYVQMFDRDITLPNTQIPDAKKVYIIFSDGIRGVMWTQNVSKARLVIVDDTKNNYRYQITIRNPQEYGLDFTNDVLWILSTFHLTGQINKPKLPTQPAYPKEEIDTKIKGEERINQK